MLVRSLLWAYCVPAAKTTPAVLSRVLPSGERDEDGSQSAGWTRRGSSGVTGRGRPAQGRGSRVSPGAGAEAQRGGASAEGGGAPVTGSLVGAAASEQGLLGRGLVTETQWGPDGRAVVEGQTEGGAC